MEPDTQLQRGIGASASNNHFSSLHQSLGVAILGLRVCHMKISSVFLDCVFWNIQLHLLILISIKCLA
ncbi:hypothetical protein SKAU_G00413050 [Synaphobranchus kaupii]|uniref:Uncharacterized protein n=1 Tax=Synaphobranchus kaupii TaxID=118154 RepID=A0A9Q1E844_SYNKA|nr:hypothetical protein SKAU_G00413050 [Synaphobranchus kaupii]